jgi:hypothetical protein
MGSIDFYAAVSHYQIFPRLVPHRRIEPIGEYLSTEICSFPDGMRILESSTSKLSPSTRQISPLEVAKTTRGLKQGCRIFLGTTYQNGKNIPKKP